MNRRHFLVGTSALTLLAALPISATAVAEGAAIDNNVAAKTGIDTIQPVFKTRIVTILGSSQKETCEEYVGRFFSYCQNDTPYPTFSVGDAYFTEVIKNANTAAKTAKEYHLISLVGNTAQSVHGNEWVSEHLRMAMRHDREMFLIERIAGRHATTGPTEIQSIISIGLRIAGSIHAETLQELFESVTLGLGEQTTHLAAGEKLQVFHDMNDVTDQFVEWVTAQNMVV